MAAPPSSEALEAVASYVAEYLQYHDFARTLLAFAEERQAFVLAEGKRAKSLGDVGGVFEGGATEAERAGMAAEMLRLFSYGERDAFFRLWEQLVPAALRRADDATRRVEFRAHVYFALFPGNQPNQANKSARAEAMAAFHAFLNARGAGEMAADPEFIPFYALPYVDDPRTHPSFAALCTSTWADEQVAAMTDFVNTVPAAPPKPTIYRLYDAHVGLVAAADGGAAARAPAPAEAARPPSSGTALLETDAPLDDVLNHRADASGEAKSAGGALDALAARWGEGDDVPLMASTRDGPAAAIAADAMRLLNEPDGATGVPDPTQPLRASANAGMRKSVTFHNDVVLGDAPPARPRSAWVPPAPLHYERVRYALTEGADDEAAAVLEALRWRITRAPAGSPRLGALRALVTEDALGTEGSTGAACLEACCAADKPVHLQEQAVWLANAMASDSVGRRYLTSKGPGVVYTLVDLLNAQLDAHRDSLAAQEQGSAPLPFDTPIVQQALGALQKLSLVRSSQTAMIARGAVAFVCDALRDPDGVLSDYTVEYGAALLMNLSLRSAGKVACEDPSLGILTVLSELLESNNPQVRTYINGTLYSIFQRPAIREQGRAMGLGEFLDLVRSQSDGTVFAKQVDYVIAQLNVEDAAEDANADAMSDDEGDESVQDDEDDSSALDDVGEDSRLDAAAYSVAMPEDVERGEPLLCRSYLADEGAATEQNARVRASIMEDAGAASGSADGPPRNDVELYQRPVTPRARPSTAEEVEARERERAKEEAARLAARNPDGETTGGKLEEEYVSGFLTQDLVPRTPNHPPR